MECDSKENPNPDYVFCLCIDMIGSTEAGLQLSQDKCVSFNRSLVEQIKPYLKEFELSEALLKFTGDGWLLMTNELIKLSPLCCLAIVMAKRFQEDIHKGSGVDKKHVPPLRLAICSGSDISVKLPNGQRDWVGDSARRATRASKVCMANEIIVDEPVRAHIFRDFQIQPVPNERVQEVQKRTKWEEDIYLHILGPLKPGTCADSQAPEHYVRLLALIGEKGASFEVATKAAGVLAHQAKREFISKEESLQQDLRRWNRLMSSLPDYNGALKIFDLLQQAGLSPDVVTYSMLVAKAPDYRTALRLVADMREEGIRPNIVTCSALVAKAPDYKAALECLAKMRKEGIQPDVFTYSTLMKKAPNYEVAHGWLAEIRKESIQPDVVTYNTLIAKASDHETARALLGEMREEDIQPDVVTYSTLVRKAPSYETARWWLGEMRKEGIQPNVFTYSTLVRKAPDYNTALEWMDDIRKDGIKPDVVTYSTLMKKAPDYEAAREWLREMRKEGIQPDVFTYNTLVAKALDYDTALDCVADMRKEGIQPNVVTYNALFSRNLSGKSADEILKWYLAQEFHPDEPIQVAIGTYRKIGLIDQALRLALDYPHLQAAQKLISFHREEAIQYFQNIFDRDPRHPNAAYALGTALFILGREKEAIPYLKKALELPTTPARRLRIEEWLREIESRTPPRKS